MGSGLDIKAARLDARMSQAHLAKAAGVSRRTIVRAESGKPLSSETVRCLMAVLDGGAPNQIGAPVAQGPARLIAMGWMDECAVDSLRHAAQYAVKQFGHYEALYVGVAPYRDGHVWEAHEGGGGVGHLEEAVKALDVGGGWFVTAHRVFTVSLMDGRPAFLLHPWSKTPDVSGMHDMRAGGSRLRMIRAPFDPLRQEAHRDMVASSGCRAPKAWASSMMCMHGAPA